MKIRTSTKGVEHFLQIIIVTVFMCPVFNAIFVLYNPCQPPFLGVMTNFCEDGTWSESLLAALLRLPAMVDFWMSFVCNTSGGVFLTMLYAACDASFLEYLDEVWRLVDFHGRNQETRVRPTE